MPVTSPTSQRSTAAYRARGAVTRRCRVLGMSLRGRRGVLRSVWEHIGMGAAAAAPPQAQAQPQPLIVVDELVFLSHPFAWEEQAHDGGERAWGGFSAEQLVAMERQVSDRWAGAIRSLGPTAALVINCMPSVKDEDLRQADQAAAAATVNASRASARLVAVARAHIGSHRLVVLSGSSQIGGPDGAPSGVVLPTSAWGREIRRLLQSHGLQYDPATVRAEVWGQSSEGCVQWYAARFAAALTLPRGFSMRYDLTFPDAPFAMVGQHVETLLACSCEPKAAESNCSRRDVVAHTFRSKSEERPFAVFIPGVVLDDEPVRTIVLRAAANAVAFTNKASAPAAVEATGTGIWTAEGMEVFDFTVRLVEIEVVYVWGRSGPGGYEALRDVVQHALDQQA
jgi:hypothetical protein